MSDPQLFAPPITAALWAAIRDVLQTPAILALTRSPAGKPRVYVEGEETGPEGSEAELWGRVVVVPVLNPFVTWVANQPLEVAFLVRCDWNDVRRAGYNPTLEMEAVQRDAYQTLTAWLPAPTTMADVMVARRLYLHRPWQPRALYDETAGTLFLSAEYRLEVADRPAP